MKKGWVWHCDRALEVVEILTPSSSDHGDWTYKTYKDVRTGYTLLVGEVGGMFATEKQCLRAQLKAEKYVLKTMETDARNQSGFVKKLEKLLKCT